MIFEVIFEFFIELVSDLRTKFKKKRNPDYDDRRSVFGIIALFITAATLLIILILIEWIFPNLLDIVRFTTKN